MPYKITLSSIARPKATGFEIKWRDFMRSVGSLVHFRHPRGKRSAALFIAIAAAAAASAAPAANAQAETTVADAAKACALLAGAKVAPSAFALPSGEAIIKEAVMTAPTAAMPEYCRVRGAIAAAGANDPPILFQVNLPSRWNLKTVQYGGGGYNGVLIEATGPFRGGALV